MKEEKLANIGKWNYAFSEARTDEEHTENIACHIEHKHKHCTENTALFSGDLPSFCNRQLFLVS